MRACSRVSTLLDRFTVGCFLVLFCSYAAAHAGHDVQLERLNKAIADQPRSQSLYLERAALHTQAHRFDAAEADFIQAEKLGAPVATSYHRALWFEARQDYAAAHAALSRYITYSPNSHYAFEARARVAQALGDKRAAVADLRKNLALIAQPNPGNYIAAANLLEGLGEIDAALTLLDAGLARLGVVPPLQRAAIALEQKRANRLGAITRLETLREPLRENAQWKLEMAALLMTAERTQEAATMLDGLEADLLSKRATPVRSRQLREAADLRMQIAGKQRFTNETPSSQAIQPRD